MAQYLNDKCIPGQILDSLHYHVVSLIYLPVQSWERGFGLFIGSSPREPITQIYIYIYHWQCNPAGFLKASSRF